MWLFLDLSIQRPWVFSPPDRTPCLLTAFDESHPAAVIIIPVVLCSSLQSFLVLLLFFFEIKGLEFHGISITRSLVTVFSGCQIRPYSSPAFSLFPENLKICKSGGLSNWNWNLKLQHFCIFFNLIVLFNFCMHIYPAVWWEGFRYLK